MHTTHLRHRSTRKRHREQSHRSWKSQNPNSRRTPPAAQDKPERMRGWNNECEAGTAENAATHGNPRQSPYGGHETAIIVVYEGCDECLGFRASHAHLCASLRTLGGAFVEGPSCVRPSRCELPFGSRGPWRGLAREAATMQRRKAACSSERDRSRKRGAQVQWQHTRKGRERAPWCRRRPAVSAGDG
jgi:hypothetical protein